jgi:GDP-4-dehydro-6-deoxy-D-mannose reductase
MSVMLVGGESCLGYHLLQLLGHGTGELISVSSSLPNEYFRLGHATYAAVDLLDFKQTINLLQEHKPTEIYHIISQEMNLVTANAKLGHLLQSLILGTNNLFEAIRHAVPKARILLVSSAEIYGSGRGVVDVIHRESDPAIPFSTYATAMASCELLVRQFINTHHLDLAVVRPFGVTGPFQHRKFVLPSVADQIARIELHDGETVIYTGNLDVSRDYLDVRDQARAVAMLMKRAVQGEVYNVCSGKARTIRDLVTFIASLSGCPVETRVDPARERAIDIPLLVGSPEKIMQLTGWKPIIRIEDSLRDLYAEIKARISAGCPL